MRGRNVGEKRKFKLQVANTVISNKWWEKRCRAEIARRKNTKDTRCNFKYEI